MTGEAKGTFVVTLEPQTLEGQPEGSSLARMSIDKQIAGDLSFKGDLGKSLQGPATVSGQIQLDRQIQVVTP